MPEQECRRSVWQSEGEWPEEYGEEEKPKNKRRRIKKKAETPFPVEKIENGICYLRDKRYIKIIEVEPINFLLRSAREQRNIIYSYMSYLKISPVRMQIKVISEKADISNHLDKIQEEIKTEQDARCRILLMDYYNLIRRIGLKEAVTRRFFLLFLNMNQCRAVVRKMKKRMQSINWRWRRERQGHTLCNAATEW